MFGLTDDFDHHALAGTMPGKVHNLSSGDTAATLKVVSWVNGNLPKDINFKGSEPGAKERVLKKDTIVRIYWGDYVAHDPTNYAKTKTLHYPVKEGGSSWYLIEVSPDETNQFWSYYDNPQADKLYASPEYQKDNFARLKRLSVTDLKPEDLKPLEDTPEAIADAEDLLETWGLEVLNKPATPPPATTPPVATSKPGVSPQEAGIGIGALVLAGVALWFLTRKK